jgi:hypothetical protein
MWRGLKYVLFDWTVSPRMLEFNEQRPVLYQLVTTPVVTFVFSATLVLLAVVAILILGL